MTEKKSLKATKKNIEKKLKSVEAKRDAGSKNMQIIRELLPEINKYQVEGYTLDQIFNAIIDETEDISITFNTFKIYLRRVRKDKSDGGPLPKGPVPKKRE